MHPDHLLGAPKIPGTPKNAIELDCFRLRLFSGDRLSGTARDATFNVDIPREIGDGYHLAVETFWLSGTTAPTGSVDRIYNFRMLGIPLKDNYAATPNPESDIIFSTVRQTDTLYITRHVSCDKIGIPLSDLGQIRNRPVRVIVTDGTNAPHSDSGLTTWCMQLCFYKKR